MIEGSAPVLVWWAALSLVSVCNIGAWVVSARRLVARRALHPSDVLDARRWHLALSAVYVLVCAFRSVLPRADVQRICLYDSWLSSVAVGRSVATVAELCFVIQWALLLREYARDAGDRFALGVSRAIVPVITIAEVSSWTAVLTTCFVWNALENSLWAFTVAWIAVALVRLRARAEGPLRRLIPVALVGCAAFVAFIATVDAPMYLARWRADEAAGKTYLSLSEGLADVLNRRVVTRAWEDWREEIAWMSGYFSLAVWLSIALAHAPRYRR